jgi:ABC-type multidrug transport system ATPase subunit
MEHTSADCGDHGSQGGSMLRITDLSKTYPNGVRALDGVNLTIPNGLFGLLGPNGAGKSTLMRTIATLQEADSGVVGFDGIDVLEEKQAVRRILGYLPQEFGVYPKISAEDMLNHLAVLKGLVSRPERRVAVEHLLRMTNLWEVRGRKLGTFSGGMRQRFGIAQALLGEPRLLIVDEPTAGLDPEERNRFLNLLSAIGEQVVVILSTHIVEDVRDLCTRMAIISEGRVLLQGDPREVVEDLRGRVWQKEMSADEVDRMHPDIRLLSSRLQGGRSVVHVHAESHPGDGFRPVDPDLEDAYFATLQRQSAAA